MIVCTVSHCSTTDVVDVVVSIEEVFIVVVIIAVVLVRALSAVVEVEAEEDTVVVLNGLAATCRRPEGCS